MLIIFFTDFLNDFPIYFFSNMSRIEKGGSQQTSLLDVLKKKMRQAREEAEQAKDEADEVKRHLEEERKKREDVCYLIF